MEPKLGHASSRRIISRLIPRPPLDVATKARPLVRVHFAACKQGVNGRPQIGSGHGIQVARAAVIELPAISQTAVAAKDVEIGRAGCGVALGYLLRFVVTNRE